MNEGSVVVITGKLDDRVREKARGDLIYGTIVFRVGNSLWVMLDDGDLWRGPLYEVAELPKQA